MTVIYRLFSLEPLYTGLTVLRLSNLVSRWLISNELTQQDGTKNMTAKRLCVTNMMGLLAVCFYCCDVQLI